MAAARRKRRKEAVEQIARQRNIRGSRGSARSKGLTDLGPGSKVRRKPARSPRICSTGRANKSASA